MKRQSALIAKNFKRTFLSCEKDQETILRKLFVESKPYSDFLKRLLIVNTKDCLDNSQHQYQTLIDQYSLKDLVDKRYIRVVPKLEFDEHEEAKTYVLIEFDDFVPSRNKEYRDCIINVNIISLIDEWELEDYKLRPWQIAGYIDGILNGTKLSGIGVLNFMGANQVLFNEQIGGVIIRYKATHMLESDDTDKIIDKWPGKAVNQNQLK